MALDLVSGGTNWLASLTENASLQAGWPMVAPSPKIIPILIKHHLGMEIFRRLDLFLDGSQSGSIAQAS